LEFDNLKFRNGNRFKIAGKIRFNTVGSGSGTPNIRIDDVTLYSTAANSSYASVTAGLRTEPATLSSLINTQASSSLNFDFLVTDDANTTNGNDSLPTLISQIVITQGAGNDIADWTQAIVGAELSDGANSITGTVNAANITFSGINTVNLGNVWDNGTKTYLLKVWLKNALGGTLPTTVDILNLAFKIDRSNFTTASSATSTQFDSGIGTAIESGATNNEITVVATKLNFVQQPSNTAINVSMTPAVTISADDANGNRDRNYASSVSITSSGPTSPYTGSAIPKGIVKVGQAFIVQAKSTGMNLPIRFTNTMRTTSGGNFFQKNIMKNRFWLTMTSPNNLINTISVGYITGATNNYETDFDG